MPARKPKPRAPKPVKAWAIVWLPMGVFVSSEARGVPYLWATKKQTQVAARRSKDHRPIRVLIVPEESDE